jgi:hypothetical protein
MRAKILRIVRGTVRISIRDLQRRTNYNRRSFGVDEPIRVWYEALSSLEKQGLAKSVNDSGVPVRAVEADVMSRTWVLACHQSV